MASNPSASLYFVEALWYGKLDKFASSSCELNDVLIGGCAAEVGAPNLNKIFNGKI